MSSKSNINEIWERLQPEARALWSDIGERLLIGQERYGGFKFGEHDLDQMALEELEDFLVYIVAKRFIKDRKG